MAKTTPTADTTAEKKETAPTFTRDQLAASKRYATRRDLVNVLLEDGKQYTLAEVDEKIEAFKKGKVR